MISNVITCDQLRWKINSNFFNWYFWAKFPDFYIQIQMFTRHLAVSKNPDFYTISHHNMERCCCCFYQIKTKSDNNFIWQWTFNWFSFLKGIHEIIFKFHLICSPFIIQFLCHTNKKWKKIWCYLEKVSNCNISVDLYHWSESPILIVIYDSIELTYILVKVLKLCIALK